MAVATTFAGFSPDGIQFMADLAANNDRAWFQPRKADFERLVKEPMELLMVALAERFETRGDPAGRRPEAVAVPDLPRHPLLARQVAVQDAPRREHPVGRGPAARAGEGSEADDGPHGNGAYFNFQPGEMYAGGGHVDAGEAEARRVPPGPRRRSRRASTPRSRIRPSSPGSAASRATSR